MQIEVLRLIQKHAGGPVLICVPLSVRQEFRRDGAMPGVTFKFIRSAAEMERWPLLLPGPSTTSRSATAQA